MDGTAIKAMMAELAPVIGEYFDARNAPIVAENKALAQRVAELEARPVPANGESGVGISDIVKSDNVLIFRLTDNTEKKIDFRDGKDGEPGPPPSIEAIREAMAEPISDAVAAAVSEIPRGEKGEPGPPGESGPAPEPEAVAELFREMAQGIVTETVSAAIAKLPAPERGEKGERGEPGADGAGIADLLMDHEGNLVATLDDGRMKNIGPVRGRDGERGADGRDGTNGRDGFSLEDFDIVPNEDGRTIEMRFQQGDVRHTYELVFPVVIDRGVFKEGSYHVGDGVTWGGSYWIAQRETSSKPDGPDSGWRLAVKKGRDGRDSK